MHRRHMITISVALALLVGALAGNAFAQERPDPPPVSETALTYVGISRGEVMPYKPNIVGRDIVISGPDPIVTRVSYDVFLRGGNMYDAAIPGMWMTLIMSEQYMPGTSPIMLFDSETERVYAYQGVGAAAGVATIDYFAERGHTEHVPRSGYGNDGHDALMRMGVPSEPDGMIALLKRFGTMSFTEVMADVLELMETGYPVNTIMAGRINSDSTYWYDERGELPVFAGNVAHFTQHGRKVGIGDFLVDEGSARTLRVMMEAEQDALAAGATREEALSAARDAFYKGEIAEAVHEFMQEHDGMVSYDDYANYEGQWFEQEELHHTNYLGFDIWTEPTYTQAGLYVIYANILKNFDLYEVGYMTADYIHLLAQVYALGMIDRWQWFGDPDFVDVPEGLWTEEYGTLRASLIDLSKPFDWIPPPGDPVNMEAVLEGWEAPAQVFAQGPMGDPPGLAWDSPDGGVVAQLHANISGGAVDTISFVIADGEGNMLNYCPSDGRTGGVPVLPGYGFGLSMRTRQFTLIEGHAGRIEPGKRVVSTPHTSIVTKDGEAYLATSSVSGDQQTQGLWITMLNDLVWGMTPQVALEQPKIVQYNYFSHFTPHFSAFNPERLLIDEDIPEETAEELRARGWQVDRRANWATVGSVVTVRRNPDGVLLGGSNIRSERYTFGR